MGEEEKAELGDEAGDMKGLGEKGGPVTLGGGGPEEGAVTDEDIL